MRITIIVVFVLGLAAFFACGDFLGNNEEDADDSQTTEADVQTGCEWTVAESYPEQIFGECKYSLANATTFAIALDDLRPDESTLVVIIDGVQLASDAVSYDSSINTITLRLSGTYSGVNQLKIRYTATTENRN